MDALKIVIDPSIMDEDGLTEQEVKELVETLQQMIENGTLLDMSTPVDMEELADSDPDLHDLLIERMERLDTTTKPTLH